MKCNALPTKTSLDYIQTGTQVFFSIPKAIKSDQLFKLDLKHKTW